MGIVLTGTFDASQILSSLDKVQAAVERVADKTDKMTAQSEAATSGIGKLKEAFTRLAPIIAAVASAQQIMKVAIALGEVGAASMRARTSLDAITGSQAPQFIDKVTQASNNAISQMDAMAISARALQLGVVNTAGEMRQLVQIGTALGRVMGLDATQAVNDLATGIGRLSPLILDNLGINIKLSDAYATYAAQLGIATDELTKAQQQQAALNEVIRQGQPVVAAMSSEQADMVTRQEQSAAAWDDAKAAFGRFIAGTGVAREFLTLLTDSAEAVERVANKMEEASQEAQAQRDYQRELQYQILLNSESFEEYEAVLKRAGVATDELVGVDQRLIDQQLTLTGISKQAAAATFEYNHQMAVQGEEAEQYDSTIRKVAEATANMTGNTDANTAALEANSEAMAAAAQRLEGIYDVNERLAGTVQSLIDLSAEQAGQWTSQADSADLLIANLEAMGVPAQTILGIQTELGLASGQITESMIAQAEAQQVLAGLVADEAILAEDALALSQDIANGRVQAIDDVMALAAAHEEQLAQAEAADDGVMSLGESLGAFSEEAPKAADPVTQSLLDIAGAVQTNIDKMEELKQTILGMQRFTISGSILVTVTSGGAAQGVENFEGGILLVGEEGPELVTLPRGSSVIPAPETRNILAGATPMPLPIAATIPGQATMLQAAPQVSIGPTTIINQLDGWEMTRIVIRNMQQMGEIENTVKI